jgi:hypothetical protein
MTLATFILLGGVLHFGILIASSLVPQVLDWRKDLASLSPVTRQLVWVHGGFIVLTIIGFGVLSVVFHATLADGSVLARGVCGFIALFWAARFALQFFLFHPTQYLTNWFLTIGYHGLTLTFAAFVAIYGYAAVK